MQNGGLSCFWNWTAGDIRLRSMGTSDEFIPWGGSGGPLLGLGWLVARRRKWSLPKQGARINDLLYLSRLNFSTLQDFLLFLQI